MTSIVVRLWESRLALALLVILLALAPLLLGCLGKRYYQAQVPWGYVFDIGGPREITEWTLNHTEAQKITDGMATLESLMFANFSKEPREAMKGYLRVHQKLLDGWPGFQPSPLRPGEMRDRQGMLQMSRYSVKHQAERLHPDNELAQELWRQLREIDPNAETDLPKPHKPDMPPLFGES